MVQGRRPDLQQVMPVSHVAAQAAWPDADNSAGRDNLAHEGLPVFCAALH